METDSASRLFSFVSSSSMLPTTNIIPVWPSLILNFTVALFPSLFFVTTLDVGNSVACSNQIAAALRPSEILNYIHLITIVFFFRKSSIETRKLT